MERKERRTSVSEISGSAMDAFYSWLVPHLDRLFEDPGLQKELSKRLSELSPDLRWEIGPDQDSGRFFAFSPNLNRDRLKVTEYLAAAAPQVPGWHFFSARPRKKWVRREIRMKGQGDKVESFPLDQWIYTLTSFQDGAFFDVNLVPIGTDASDAKLQMLGEMLVQSELGERLFLEFIDRVNIVDSGSLAHSGDSIVHLHDHITEELKKHPRH